ncbi:MAG: FtsX-like permease family protein [Candidatus Asgardarchaeia archaeon]
MSVKLFLLTKRMLVRSGSKSSLAVAALAAGTGTLTASLTVYNALVSQSFFRLLIPVMVILGLSTFMFGSLFVFFVTYTLFSERRSIVGVLKTVGYPNKFISQLFSLQGLILGFSGSLIGVTFGANLVGALLFSWFYHYFLLPFRSHQPYTEWSGIIFLLGVLFPYVLSKSIARKAAEMSVTQAFTKIPDVYNPYILSSFRSNFELYAIRRKIRRPVIYRLIMIITFITLISTSLVVYSYSLVPYNNSSYFRFIIYVYQRVSVVSYLIILMTGFLGFYSIWNSEQLRRKNEFSVMKTVGWSNKDLLMITLYELKYIIAYPLIISIIILIVGSLSTGGIGSIIINGLLLGMLNALIVATLLSITAILIVYKIIRKPVVENLKVLEMELLQEFR